MKPNYIYGQKNWPQFVWDKDILSRKIEKVRLMQGKLLGKMEGLDFKLQEEAVLQSLTEDILKTSEIEGESLDRSQVRSSVARRLGMDLAGLVKSDRNVEGIVEVMLDATQKFKEPLTQDRLFGWHAALFPTGRSGMSKIVVGQWRDDSAGPMQVVSGPIGNEKIHYEAPQAKKLKKDMREFLTWVNAKKMKIRYCKQELRICGL